MPQLRTHKSKPKSKNSKREKWNHGMMNRKYINRSRMRLPWWNNLQDRKVGLIRSIHHIWQTQTLWITMKWFWIICRIILRILLRKNWTLWTHQVSTHPPIWVLSQSVMRVRITFLVRVLCSHSWESRQRISLPILDQEGSLIGIIRTIISQKKRLIILLDKYRMSWIFLNPKKLQIKHNLQNKFQANIVRNY